MLERNGDDRLEGLLGMKYKATALAAALLVLASVPALAHESGMTVHRGSASETVALDAQGLAQIKGTRLKAESEARRAAVSHYRGHHSRHHGKSLGKSLAVRAISGETLWLVDGQDGGLVACKLLETADFGRREIGCARSNFETALRRGF
jgi:hypothetical protein